MKKSLFFLSVFTLLIIACKKDKNNSDDRSVLQGSVSVQIILPKGSPIDISKTQIFTLGKSYKVDSKGKANIDFYGNGGQLASLFNESGQLLLESYITTVSKEISIKTTSQALLFQSMQMIFLPDSAKFPFLLKTTDYPPLTEYYSQMEKAFIADPLILENKNFKSILSQAITQVKQKNVNDIYGRFMDVITNEEKSKIEINEIDDENVNIINHYYRRAWAYIYKTEYVKKENHEVVTIWDKIPKEAEARKDTKVEKVKFVGKKIDQMGVVSGDIKATTGPVNLPILDDEAEVTYKIRVIGPGKEVGGGELSGLTQTEDMKLLGTLYQEYFAYDILAPMLLENLGYRSLLPELDEDNLSSYFNKVNSLTLSNGDIITNVREGKVRDAIQLFSQVMDQNKVSVYDIYEELINGFRATYKNIYNTSQEDKNENFDKAKKVYNLLAYLSFENAEAEDFIIASHKYFNELEEFEVKVSNNEVRLSPKEGVTSTFTDYLLVASVNVDTSGGNTIKYKWTTTGKYGVLKEVGASSQGT
ncbi:MAG: hypothetical protein M9887_08670 [Chitinophagales bacterium]|nr:hypothetical protein [Chitinophagales bacterium]